MNEQSMEHNTIIGKICVTVSAIGSYVSLRAFAENAQPFVTLTASIISIAAGLFAIRYYIKKSK